LSPNSSSFPTFLFPARCREALARLATSQQQSTGPGQQPARGKWSGEHFADPLNWSPSLYSASCGLYLLYIDSFQSLPLCTWVQRLPHNFLLPFFKSSSLFYLSSPFESSPIGRRSRLTSCSYLHNQFLVLLSQNLSFSLPSHLLHLNFTSGYTLNPSVFLAPIPHSWDTFFSPQQPT
jgi:hypothetical protein